jgi:hypothetical protein
MSIAPLLLLLLAIAITLNLISSKYIWALLSWLVLGAVLFGMATHIHQSVLAGEASLQELLLTTTLIVIGGLFLLKITLPQPVWQKLWHDGIERLVRSGLSLLGKSFARLLEFFATRR